MRKTVKNIEKAIILVLLFFTVFGWTWAISRVMVREPGLNDLSDGFDDHKFLLSDEVNVMVAGDWDMGQTIRERDTVMWVRADTRKTGVGDVVLCMDGENSIVARRIVSLDGDNFLVMGDSSGSIQYTITSSDVLGVVIGVVYWR